MLSLAERRRAMAGQLRRFANDPERCMPSERAIALKIAEELDQDGDSAVPQDDDGAGA